MVDRRVHGLKPRLLFLAVAFGLFFLPGILAADSVVRPPRSARVQSFAAGRDLIVAAHYAPWFAGMEGGWFNKVGNKTIKTAWTPFLGYYDNRQPATLSKHIEWALAYRVNTFMIEWSGVRSEAFPHSFEDVVHTFLANPDFKKIKFFFVYSLTGAFEKAGEGVPETVDFDDPAIVAKFVSDFKYAAKTYFGRPNHLKHGGKPVVYVWATAAARGDLKGALTKVRRAVKASFGYDLCLIADQVGWGAVPDLVTAPLWDGAMPYIMLKITSPVRNYKLSATVPEIVRQYKHWRNACEDLGVPFVPGVFAGQNGSGASWHYGDDGKLTTPIVARSPESFRTFVREAKELVDPGLRMIFICSWSEWNEGTNIEPAKEFGFDYLDVVKKNLARYVPGRRPKDVLTFKFKVLWNPDPGGEGSRRLAAAFDYVEFLDAGGKVLLKVDIGSAAARKDMGFGWFDDEGAWGDEVMNFAWAGEARKCATVHVDIPAAAAAIRFKALQVKGPQSITVVLNGTALAAFPVVTPQSWSVYTAPIK